MSTIKLASLIRESITTKKKILKDKQFLTAIDQAAKTIMASMKNDGKLLIAGNGGSAADAQHFAAELVGKFERTRPGLRALALTTDSSFITAWGNDDSFANIFARQIQALAKPGDVFFGISTSGQSTNILRALAAAKKAKMRTIALLGRDGGRAVRLAEHALVVPSSSTPRIQESHILIIHLLCYQIESEFGW